MIGTILPHILLYVKNGSLILSATGSTPAKEEYPMGDARKDALRVEFDSRIKLEFDGAVVTSDAGLVAYRELDEALGLAGRCKTRLA